jgi:outer membrane protein OmpA-like peptidoglycan-associated protein
MSIAIAGHTDNVGEPGANMLLSVERANAVANYLITRGVSGSRLKASGYGDTKPAVPNDTPENQAKNRRTEFTILGGGTTNPS